MAAHLILFSRDFNHLHVDKNFLKHLSFADLNVIRYQGALWIQAIPKRCVAMSDVLSGEEQQSEALWV